MDFRLIRLDLLNLGWLLIGLGMYLSLLRLFLMLIVYLGFWGLVDMIDLLWLLFSLVVDVLGLLWLLFSLIVHLLTRLWLLWTWVADVLGLLLMVVDLLGLLVTVVNLLGLLMVLFLVNNWGTIGGDGMAVRSHWCQVSIVCSLRLSWCSIRSSWSRLGSLECHLGNVVGCLLSLLGLVVLNWSSVSGSRDHWTSLLDWSLVRRSTLVVVLLSAINGAGWGVAGWSIYRSWTAETS